ncbi:Retrovirus-related Pol polyprotein from transposon 17.6, partial [Mucuna pruriens]
MAPKDKEKITFITTWGTFYYKVMPFELKNTGATYQRAMVTLFHDMMHKEVEVYVDDMIAKLRKYKLRLNPAKCTFGVKTRKLLGFIVNERGIEVNPDKVKAIQNMSTPRTEIEPHIQTPSEKSEDGVEPEVPGGFRESQMIPRDASCPRPDDTRKAPDPLLINCEQRYPTLVRTCCALVWTAKRLRQYMLAHTKWLIAKMDPLKYIFEKLALTGRIARWQMALLEYDIINKSQKAIKGSTLAEQLAHHPLEDYQSLLHKFHDEHIMSVEGETGFEAKSGEWKLWFDEASNLLGNGIGAVLVSPKG